MTTSAVNPTAAVGIHLTADLPFVSLVPADSGQPQIKLYYLLKARQAIKTKKTSAVKPQHAT